MPESPDTHPVESEGTESRSGSTHLADKPVSGRGRLLSSFTRPTRSQLVVAVLLGVLGLAAVTQVRANELTNAYAGYREQDLIDILNGLSTLSERTEREIARLEEARDDLQSTRTSRQAALEQAQTTADNLSILAGIVAVSGPGIRITIEDGPEPLSIDVLLDVIQELRTANAEAIEVNDQVRVVAHTALEVTGEGIVVDGQLLESPYVLDVIGEPNTLSGAMTFSRGPKDVIESKGGTLSIDERSTIEIESVTTPTTPEFAVPE
jgi:uncharacterized protein YlxW (UPF0749 family)